MHARPTSRLILLALASVLAEAAYLSGCAAAPPKPELQKDRLGLFPVEAQDPRAAKCATCHAAIAEQWSGSYHAKAWRDPLFRVSTQNRQQAECLPCHAPQPVLDRPFGAPPELRPGFRDDGVSCLTCHDVGAGDCPRGLPGPRREELRKRLADPQSCASCHNTTHWALDEWNAWSGSKGPNRTGCIDCHMPTKTIIPWEGAEPRLVRSHAFPSWQSPAFVMGSLDCSADVNGTQLTLTMKNLVGHKFPGEVPTRKLIVIVQGEGGPDQDPLDQREEYCRPPKNGPVGIPDTRLKPDEKRQLNTPLPPGILRVEVRVLFQAIPLTPEDECLCLFRRAFTKDPATGTWTPLADRPISGRKP